MRLAVLWLMFSFSSVEAIKIDVKNLSGKANWTDGCGTEAYEMTIWAKVFKKENDQLTYLFGMGAIINASTNCGHNTTLDPLPENQDYELQLWIDIKVRRETEETTSSFMIRKYENVTNGEHFFVELIDVEFRGDDYLGTIHRTGMRAPYIHVNTQEFESTSCA